MTKIVTIVGVGALGSHLVQFLRNEDVELRVIDFDRVEQRNVASQFHSKTHVGKLKVHSIKQTMQFLYGAKIMAVNCKLADNNVDTTVFGDLVIDCLDNGEARRLVQAHVRAKDIPCLHGALAVNGEFGRVIWDEHFQIDDEPSGDEVATCEDGDFLPFIVNVSAYLAKAAQVFLREDKKIGFSITPTSIFAV